MALTQPQIAAVARTLAQQMFAAAPADLALDQIIAAVAAADAYMDATSGAFVSALPGAFKSVSDIHDFSKLAALTANARAGY
jgi:hypothetical protein